MKKSNNLIRIKAFQLKSEKQKLPQIEAMLKAFNDLVIQLQKQIHIEEQNSGIFDKESYRYPPAAKACALRAENLQLSINELDNQRKTIIDNINKLLEELSSLQRIELAQPCPSPRRIKA